MKLLNEPYASGLPAERWPRARRHRGSCRPRRYKLGLTRTRLADAERVKGPPSKFRNNIAVSATILRSGKTTSESTINAPRPSDGTESDDQARLHR